MESGRRFRLGAGCRNGPSSSAPTLQGCRRSCSGLGTAAYSARKLAPRSPAAPGHPSVSAQTAPRPAKQAPLFSRPRRPHFTALVTTASYLRFFLDASLDRTPVVGICLANSRRASNTLELTNEELTEVLNQLCGCNSWPSLAPSGSLGTSVLTPQGQADPRVEGSAVRVGEGEELLHRNSGLAQVSPGGLSRDQAVRRRQPSGVAMWRDPRPRLDEGNRGALRSHPACHPLGRVSGPC